MSFRVHPRVPFAASGPSWRPARLAAGVATLCLALAPLASASAQVKEGFDDRTGPEPPPETRLDSLAELHKIHVSPNAIVFDARTRTATVSFRNISNRPIIGEVQVLYSYPEWPHGLPADTTVITTDMQTLLERDTTILNPGPKDHYAGRWLSGLPERLTLAPHETRQVTLKLAPPASVANGEYSARLVVIVKPQDQRRAPGARDVKEHYAMPIKGAINPLRDSVRIFYRQGALKSALSFGPGAVARFDSAGLGGPDPRDCPKSLWIKLPMHLTGNAHVEGRLTVTYRNVETGQLVPVNRFPVSLYHDAVTHWWTHTCWVPVGKYQVLLRFDGKQEDIPSGQQLPFATMQYTIPGTIEISR